ncbi:MAG: EAL domain-containing protein [Rhodospirillaceae bacterium]|nr:EAL domain-containing protein [Rhodospirillaceae bacterium]
MSRVTQILSTFGRKRSNVIFIAGLLASLLLITASHVRASFTAKGTHQAFNTANDSVSAFNEVRSSLFDLRLAAEDVLKSGNREAHEQHNAIVNDLLLNLEPPAAAQTSDPAVMAESRNVLAQDLRHYEQVFAQTADAVDAGHMTAAEGADRLLPMYVNLQFRAERILLDATRTIAGLDSPASRSVFWSHLTFGLAVLIFAGLAAWMWRQWRGSVGLFVAAAESERGRFRDLALATADWFIELDSDLRVSAVSEPPEGTTEVPYIVECAIGMRLEDAVAGNEGLKSSWTACQTAMSGRLPVKRFRYVVANPLLGTRHYELNGLPHFGTGGQFLGYRLAVADVTAQVNTSAKREEMEHLLTALFEHSPAMISVKDVEGRFTAMNRASETVMGISRDEAIGFDASVLMKREMAEQISEEESRVMESEEPMTFEHDIWINGSLRTYQTTRFPVLDDDGCLNSIGAIGVDVTDRRKAEEEVQRRANFDSLTDLPNRHLFQDRLTQATAFSKRTGQLIAVLHINLDGFRAINDVRGEAAGDQILFETAWRLKSCLRDTDTVARLTGDEFGIILTNLEKACDVAKIAEKITAATSEPITVDGVSCYLTVGIGYAVWPEGGETAEGLTRNADIALHRAKRSGPGRTVCYSADIGDALKQHQIIAQSLKSAVTCKELFVMYQPLVDAVTQEVVAAEALIRWENRDLGLVRPDRFIPIAEESDAIFDIGLFIMQRACRDAAAWNERRRRPVAVSVNVSPKQMLRPDFVATVKAVLDDTRLPAELLKIEVTESGLMENVGQCQKVFAELRSLGVKISLDDFGTGYSALGYLQKFEFDALKLDRSFIRDIKVGDCNNTTVAESIISMAQRLGLTIVAEGVETAEQLEFLRSNGCDQIQGFLFSPPKKLGDFTSYVVQQDLAKAA